LPIYRTAADKPSKVPLPLSPQGLEQFRFTLDSYLTDQGRELAVVAYSYPLEGNAGTCSGKLYIDPVTAALHRQELKLPSAFMLTLNTYAAVSLHPDDAMLHLIRDFVPVADSLTRLVSTRAEQNMRLETKKGFAEEVQVSSHFLVYQPTPRLPNQRYASMEQSVNDLDQIRKRPYNPQFWRDNEIIRASPVEEQVIRDLEGRRVFGKL
jgi:hypothetical protein